jgi:hypothetical protein
MKWAIIGLFLCAILTACAAAPKQYYATKSNMTPEEKKRDIYQCRIEVINAAKDMPLEHQRRLMNQCLEARGYTITDYQPSK